VFYGTARLTLIKTRISSLIEQADRRLCLDQDWWAHQLGWTVTRTGFGARRYRDPRFDTLQKDGEVEQGVIT
jgi:hypothetical protein